MYLPVAEVVALNTAPDSVFLACTALLSMGSPMESRRVPVMEPVDVAACATAAQQRIIARQSEFFICVSSWLECAGTSVRSGSSSKSYSLSK